MSIVEQLQTWYAGMKPTLEREGISSSVSVAEGADSAHLDLDGGGAIGRVTVWSRGMCDVEVLAAESGDQLVWEHFAEVTPADLNRAIEVALRHIRSGAAAT